MSKTYKEFLEEGKTSRGYWVLPNDIDNKTKTGVTKITSSDRNPSSRDKKYSRFGSKRKQEKRAERSAAYDEFKQKWGLDNTHTMIGSIFGVKKLEEENNHIQRIVTPGPYSLKQLQKNHNKMKRQIEDKYFNKKIDDKDEMFTHWKEESKEGFGPNSRQFGTHELFSRSNKSGRDDAIITSRYDTEKQQHITSWDIGH